MAFDPTAIFSAIQQFFTFGTALAPSLNLWIEAQIPIEQQHVVKRRMAQCYRICKREKFTEPVITDEVNILFKDFNATQQAEIATIINAELNVPVTAKK